MMDKENMLKEIKSLEYDINKEEIKKSGLTMFMFITILTIMGGGLALGLLFGSLSKIVMLAIAASALVNVNTINELGKTKYNLKRYSHQISEYKKKMNNVSNNVRVEVKKENNYSYKPKNKLDENKKHEVKIERFMEEDFNDFDRDNTSGRKR